MFEAEKIAALVEMQARYNESLERMRERHHIEMQGMQELVRAILQRFPTTESSGT